MKRQEYNKTYYSKKRSEISAQKKKYYEQNSAKIKKYKRNYYLRTNGKLKSRETYYKNKAAILARNLERRLERCKTEEARQKLLSRRTVVALSPEDRYFYDKWKAWQFSAKQRGLKFTLTLKAVQQLWHTQQGRCAYTGDRMLLTKDSTTCPSLDRIHSKLGYTLKNVVLCTAQSNKSKHVLSPRRFFLQCLKVVRKGLSDVAALS